MKPALAIKRLSPHAKRPIQASQGAAGYDLFFAIPEPVFIMPFSFLEIPVGWAFAIPDTHTGLVLPRSSAHKSGVKLINTVGLIDPDYRGGIKLLVQNTEEARITINPEVALFQIIFPRIDVFDLIETDELSTTDRGDGGFGSTGNG